MTAGHATGLILAAPSSGAGKTTVTLALLAALRRAAVDVRAAKSGPDYIDPAFHRAATGHASVNLDAWSMDPATLAARAAAQGGNLLLVEGAMGALDGARDGTGSVADLAAHLNLPVVLVLDAAKSGPSAALAAAGFRALRPDLRLAGVILNRVASPAHAELARDGLAAAGIECLGALPRDPNLALPERHLGLVQAEETAGLTTFLTQAADQATAHIDLGRLVDLAAPLPDAPARTQQLAPLGQRIAVAQDVAFTFLYPHLVQDWQAAGASLLPFSPLADEAPAEEADAIFLPGGYPELHAGPLANATRFRAGMIRAAARGAVIYGECGGYMVLGQGLIDAGGQRHTMLGLLPHATSFAQRKLTLGYRRLTALGGPWSGRLLGHEFHYATITDMADGPHLFQATDALGAPVAPMGLYQGTVSGSFAHVISPAPPRPNAGG